MKPEDLKKIYDQYRIFIFPVAVVISCLILIVFIIFPQIMNLIKNYQTEGRLKSRFDTMDSKVQALENVDEKDLSEKLKLALNAYPQDNDFANVAGILQELAGRFGFIINSMQVGAVSQADKGSNSQFNVQLDLTGSKVTVNDLMNSIENYPRIMKVNSIELSNAKVSSNVNAVLNIKAYFQSLPTAFGNVDTKLPQITDKDEAVLTSLARIPVSTYSGIAVPKGKANLFE